MNSLAHFHFLRPEWLWLLLPLSLLAWMAIRQQQRKDRWQAVMAPHLLEALLVNPERGKQRFEPATLLLVCWLLGTLALAGPAWNKEPTPFTEEQSALVIVLRVSPDMLAQDIQPSRLQRAVHKIRDLLELRADGRTALVAYAGSAHLVMPLTRDAEVISTFAGELEPDIMPLPGDAVSSAIALANQVLKKAQTAGSIVLLTDAIDPAEFEALRQAESTDVHILAMAAGPEVLPPANSPPAPPLDEARLREAANVLGGSLTLATIDDADVRRLNGQVARSFANAPPSEGERWRDAGYYLLPLIALLLLAFFRSGGAMVLE